MINFYLPKVNAYEPAYTVNQMIISFLKSNPNFFYDNIKISAVYGNFSPAIWNGGRVLLNGENIEVREDSYHYMKKMLSYYNDNDIAFRFTFTNKLLKEEHLLDPFCNFLMELANNGKNEVIVHSPLLENYLREKYPNFKYISSTTKCILKENEFIKDLDKYYLSVLDYRLNRSEILKNIPIEKRDKVELLINAYCATNCNVRHLHYDEMSECQIEQKSPTSWNCGFTDNFYKRLPSSHVIKVDELYNYYHKELGYNHFKIEGRGNHVISVLESYLYYLVKPKYKEYMRYLILKEIW